MWSIDNFISFLSENKITCIIIVTVILVVILYTWYAHNSKDRNKIVTSSKNTKKSLNKKTTETCSLDKIISQQEAWQGVNKDRDDPNVTAPSKDTSFESMMSLKSHDIHDGHESESEMIKSLPGAEEENLNYEKWEDKGDGH